ncbi:hypothetical protein CHUAL_009826 [Chamberlinius hualienensis]
MSVMVIERESNVEYTHRLIWPFLLFFRIFGIHLADETSKRCKYFCFALRLLWMVVLLTATVIGIDNIYFINQLLSFDDTVMTFVSCSLRITNLLTFAGLIWNQNFLYQITRDVALNFKYYIDCSGSESKRVIQHVNIARKAFMALWIILLAYVVKFFTTDTMHILDKISVMSESNVSWVKIPSLFLYDTFDVGQRLLIFRITNKLDIFVFLMSLSAMMLLIFLIILLNCSLTLAVNATKTRISSYCTVKMLTNFISQHRRHCSLLKRLNEGFSSIIFVWIVNEVFAIAFAFRTITTNYFNANILLIMIIHLSNFLGKSFVIAFTNKNIVDCLDVIYQRIMDVNQSQIEEYTLKHFANVIEQLTPKTLKNDFNQYICHLTVCKPAIDGWGYFDINKPFLVGVGGTVLSYILLLHHVSSFDGGQFDYTIVKSAKGLSFPFIPYFYVFGLNTCYTPYSNSHSRSINCVWLSLRILWFLTFLSVIVISIDDCYSKIIEYGFYQALMVFVSTLLSVNNVLTFMGMMWNRVPLFEAVHGIVFNCLEHSDERCLRQIKVSRKIFTTIWLFIFGYVVHILINNCIRLFAEYDPFDHLLANNCQDYAGFLIYWFTCYQVQVLHRLAIMHVIFTMTNNLTLIALLCFTITIITNVLKEIVYELDTNISTSCAIKTFRTFIDRHEEMSNFIKRLNDGFSFMVFIWVANEISIVALISRGMATMPTQYDFVNISVSLFTHVAGFSVRSLLIASVNDKIMSSLDLAHTRLRKLRKDIKEESREILNKLEEEFHQYCLHVSMHPPSINGWGYFDINKPLIITVGGAIISYVLLLYNINY